MKSFIFLLVILLLGVISNDVMGANVSVDPFINSMQPEWQYIPNIEFNYRDSIVRWDILSQYTLQHTAINKEGQVYKSFNISNPSGDWSNPLHYKNSSLYTVVNSNIIVTYDQINPVSQTPYYDTMKFQIDWIDTRITNTNITVPEPNPSNTFVTSRRSLIDLLIGNACTSKLPSELTNIQMSTATPDIVRLSGTCNSLNGFNLNCDRVVSKHRRKFTWTTVYSSIANSNLCANNDELYVVSMFTLSENFADTLDVFDTTFRVENHSLLYFLLNVTLHDSTSIIINNSSLYCFQFGGSGSYSFPSIHISNNSYFEFNRLILSNTELIIENSNVTRFRPSEYHYPEANFQSSKIKFRDVYFQSNMVGFTYLKDTVVNMEGFIKTDAEFDHSIYDTATWTFTNFTSNDPIYLSAFGESTVIYRECYFSAFPNSRVILYDSTKLKIYDSKGVIDQDVLHYNMTSNESAALIVGSNITILDVNIPIVLRDSELYYELHNNYEFSLDLKNSSYYGKIHGSWDITSLLSEDSLIVDDPQYFITDLKIYNALLSNTSIHTRTTQIMLMGEVAIHNWLTVTFFNVSHFYFINAYVYGVGNNAVIKIDVPDAFLIKDTGIFKYSTFYMENVTVTNMKLIVNYNFQTKNVTMKSVELCYTGNNTITTLMYFEDCIIRMNGLLTWSDYTPSSIGNNTLIGNGTFIARPLFNQPGLSIGSTSEISNITMVGHKFAYLSTLSVSIKIDGHFYSTIGINGSINSSEFNGTITINAEKVVPGTLYDIIRFNQSSNLTTNYAFSVDNAIILNTSLPYSLLVTNDTISIYFQSNPDIDFSSESSNKSKLAAIVVVPIVAMVAGAIVYKLKKKKIKPSP